MCGKYRAPGPAIYQGLIGFPIDWRCVEPYSQSQLSRLTVQTVDLRFGCIGNQLNFHHNIAMLVDAQECSQGCSGVWHGHGLWIDF